MTDTLFHKSVILRDFNSWRQSRGKLPKGLEKTNRNVEGANYATLQGTKAQINQYLQDAPIISERLRTLNSLPKYRLIQGVKVRVQ